MDLEILIDWLLKNSEHPLLPPWERAYDVSSGLIFYRNSQTRSTIFDLRPTIEFGGGIVLDNYKWSLMGHRAASFQNLVVQPLSMTLRFHSVRSFVRFYVFRASCGLIPMYIIVAHPVFQCPFCHCFIPLL